MGTIYVGSARMGENGKITGGKAGDQTGKEVSTQEFYKHSKGWYVIRPKSIEHANNIASCMKAICDNDNVGYNQNERYGIVKYGSGTKVKVNADCSSSVRRCVIEGTGKDPGDFNTSSQVRVLQATGLFEKEFTFVSQDKTPVYNGDILVTKTKGHTVVVVSGNPRVKSSVETSNNSNKVVAVSKAKSKDAGYSGTYKTKANLYIRHDAGKNSKAMVIMPKGTIVKNKGYYSQAADGKIWLYVIAVVNGVEYTGFCSREFLIK